MNTKVLVSAPYLLAVIERYREKLERGGIELIIPEVRECLGEAELLGLVGDVSGAICGDDHFTEKVLDAAPRLKVISKWGTGTDSIDRDACAERGIAVYNTVSAFTDAVADTVLGYILMFARRLHELDGDMKMGGWHKYQARALRECTLGIIGVGNIGRAVAVRASACGMKVLGNDIKDIDPAFLSDTGMVTLSKEELLPHVDFLSLNCDLNPTSLRLMDAEHIALMKSDSYIINTSRGKVVDEEVLVDALSSRRIAGAALDVFEREPLSREHPLRRMDNVFLSPHNANSSIAAWKMVHENTIRNLFKGLARGEE